MNGAQQAIDLVARALVDPGDAWRSSSRAGSARRSRSGACEAHLRRRRRRRRGPAHRRAGAHPARAPRQAALHHAGRAVADGGRRSRRRAAASCSRSPTSTSCRSSRTTTTASCVTAGPPVPALKTLDRAGQVIYVGTFSKALFPGLRVGYLVAPRALLARLALLALRRGLRTAPSLTQAALGGAARERRASSATCGACAALYAERRDALLRRARGADAGGHALHAAGRRQHASGSSCPTPPIPRRAARGRARRGIALHAGERPSPSTAASGVRREPPPRALVRESARAARSTPAVARLAATRVRRRSAGAAQEGRR